MLQKISLAPTQISKYRMVMSHEVIDEVEELARDLRGLRLCHINATPFGGGVAELLVSYIPLLRGLGIQADWQVIRGDKRFFTATKSLHNAIQGEPHPEITKTKTRRLYMRTNLENAQELDPNYDVFIVNDPQPAALRHYWSGSRVKWIWRCHIDSSQPDEEVWQTIRPYIEEYDAVVFTMKEFVPSGLDDKHVAIMAPAIDVFSSKNMFVKRYVCREMLENMGIDSRRPLLLQVSRFDPWKDPLGAIAAYRLARKEVPELQLAMVGSFAGDDPQAWEIYAQVQEEAGKDDDIHVRTNLTGVGNMEVNAFQRASDVVLQKSIKEGFGLAVAEALWKETPVVAGNAGGIPMQMSGMLSDFLVKDTEECAQKIVYLLQNPELAQELGKGGKRHITKNFLMPRLVRDELSLVKTLLRE